MNPGPLAPRSPRDRGALGVGLGVAILMFLGALVQLGALFIMITNHQHWQRTYPGRFPLTAIDLAGWVISGLSVLGYLVGLVLWLVGLRRGLGSRLTIAGIVCMCLPVVGWIGLLAL